VDTDMENVRLARMNGLDAHHGNALSEYTEEHLSLSGIGRLLALTSNDEANALACRHYKDEFGSAGIYQLVPRRYQEMGWQQGPGSRALGRLLFAKEAEWGRLIDLTRNNGVIKRTKLTQKFSYQDLEKQYAGSFLPLMAVQGKTVQVATLDGSFAPQAGWTVLSLVEGQ